MISKLSNLKESLYRSIKDVRGRIIDSEQQIFVAALCCMQKGDDEPFWKKTSKKWFNQCDEIGDFTKVIMLEDIDILGKFINSVSDELCQLESNE